MMIHRAAWALLVLATCAAPLAAQRDTIRIRIPGDSATVRVPLPDTTTGQAFDSGATAALVESVIRGGSVVPPGLREYRADMRSAIYLSFRPDSAPGGELPVTVDEVVGQILWERGGSLVQRIEGHRVRMLAPAPYTLGSLLEAPWVIPHLYGNTISVFQFSPTRSGRAPIVQAINPFSFRGIDFYRYAAGDTVRVRTRTGTTTLVPVVVRARPGNEPGQARLVAGTFWVDVDRGAVARARFGFLERSGGFRLVETGLFFELENGLVEDRYWLPYRQRREIQFATPLMGGVVAIRLVTNLSGFDLSPGWTPEEPGKYVLVRDEGDEAAAFRDWRGLPGEEDEGFDIADFADLRGAVRPVDERGGPARVSLRWQRSEHLFRYNRVEGLYLGAGALVEPRDPDRRDWSVYATGGWAFTERAVRGEVVGRWWLNPGAGPDDPAWHLQAAGYRRLQETQLFRPLLAWDLGYSLGALLGGVDVRDYYDAAGAEAHLARARGPWTLRGGGRVERQRPVQRNTDGYLFGKAEEFPPVAPADEGTHAALEGEVRYARGVGAFGIASSLVASGRVEAGVGDFRFTRATLLLGGRRPSRYLTVALRGDAGWIGGDPGPQHLFRFGGEQGLRGHDDNVFGGTAMAIGRARVLAHLPPYGNEPLARAGIFVIPPLRPALVLSGEAGWADVSEAAADELARVGSAPTDGIEAAAGVGVSLFDDALSAEWVRPLDGGEGKWYVGFTRWF